MNDYNLYTLQGYNDCGAVADAKQKKSEFSFM